MNFSGPSFIVAIVLTQHFLNFHIQCFLGHRVLEFLRWRGQSRYFEQFDNFVSPVLAQLFPQHLSLYGRTPIGRFGQLPTQTSRWQQQFDPSATARRVRLIFVFNASPPRFYLQDEINFDNFIRGVVLFGVVFAIRKNLQCV